jgi:diguanylate cyclase (GGDEF)-like protein
MFEYPSIGLSGRDLHGRVLLVTGAARGIGAEAARTFARLGASVLLADRTASGEEVAQQIRQQGGSAHFVQTELGTESGVADLVAEGERRFGAIDGVLNSAARLKMDTVIDGAIDDWDQTYHANLRAPVLLAKRTLPGMLARGRGVFMSLISLEGMPFMGGYCAQKMGLRSMMLSRGKELNAAQGVSVFSVVPGSVETPLAHEIAQEMARRFGIPVADVLASLARNPGYEGLVPVAHLGAALAWFMAHAPQFHGQVVDGYLPLSQAGLINVGPQTHASPLQASPDHPIPNPELELAELLKINRSLENRIEERTRELRQLSETLQAESARLRETNERLEQLSYEDALTGLANRRYFDQTLAREFLRLGRHKSQCSLIMVDIDHFKAFNDSAGHVAGDDCLRRIGAVLRSVCMRASDLAARYGGEEFAVILPDTDVGEARLLAERIREGIARLAIDHPNQLGAQFVTVSIGIATALVAELVDAVALVSLADEQLYRAKAAGRNRVMAATQT